MSDPDDADAELLQHAQLGDRAAFTALYDRHVRAVYWQGFRVLRDADLAEETTQDVFLTAWRRIRSIRIVDDSVLPWLMVTASQTAMNARRRSSRPDRRTEPISIDPAAARTVEDDVDDALVRAEIDKAVSGLSAVDRSLYELCLEGEHTYEQAARTLGLTHAGVRNRVHRLRARLRADLRSMRETP